MKRILAYLTCVLSIGLSSCNKEDPNRVFDEKPFALVSSYDGNRNTVSAQIDDIQKTIVFEFTKSVDLTHAKVSFQLNPGYTMVTPAENTTEIDLSVESEIVVSGHGSQLTYTISAINFTPIIEAAANFRGEQIKATINQDEHKVTFNIKNIYASEYPEMVLKNIPVEFKLGNGFQIIGNTGSFDLCGQKITLKYGRNVLTYSIEAEIAPIAVQNNLETFIFNKGVNLSYWMTEADRNWLGMVTTKQFPMWKELGFDHFRVPVDELCIFDKDHNFNEMAVEKLHEFFTWCEDNDMRAILDMHTLGPRKGSDKYVEKELYDPKYPEMRNNFVDLWTKLTEEFNCHSHSHIAFELLNEPHDYTDDASNWQGLQREVLTAIRSIDPDRVVFVPSMGWQDPKYIKYAEFLDGDPNIVITFHYYLPMLLSHYKMLAWKDYQGKVQYPGIVMPDAADAAAYPQYAEFHRTTFNADRIMGDMSMASADGANMNRMVHCGEFGCSKNVDDTQRLAWFNDMVEAMNANGIPWTIWEALDGGFSFISMDWDDGTYSIDTDLLEILTGKSLSASQASEILMKYGYKVK